MTSLHMCTAAPRTALRPRRRCGCPRRSPTIALAVGEVDDADGFHGRSGRSPLAVADVDQVDGGANNCQSSTSAAAEVPTEEPWPPVMNMNRLRRGVQRTQVSLRGTVAARAAPLAAAVARHPHLAAAMPAGWVRVDMHSHTMWSGDSTTTPDEIAAAVVEAGIDVLCITDHNAIKGAVELVDRLPCRVIVGEELRTHAGEIIGLFLNERIPIGVQPDEAARAIRDQGGLVYIPHPFDPMRRNLAEAALTR